MRYKILLFLASLMLLGGCGKYVHYDLPHNHITSPAEGGVVKYVQQGLTLSSVEIDGEKQQTSLIYEDSKIVGESAGWLRVLEGWRIKNFGVHTIEIAPNPDKKSRSAVLYFDMAKYYGEIYIYQEGRSE